MAQTTTIAVAEDDWEQLTNTDAANITFQNRNKIGSILIKGTTDTTQPTDFDGALRYLPGQGEAGRVLAELFPGLGAVRVWAYAEGQAATVVVSHD